MCNGTLVEFYLQKFIFVEYERIAMNFQDEASLKVSVRFLFLGIEIIKNP